MNVNVCVSRNSSLVDVALSHSVASAPLCIAFAVATTAIASISIFVVVVTGITSFTISSSNIHTTVDVVAARSRPSFLEC